MKWEKKQQSTVVAVGSEKVQQQGLGKKNSRGIGRLERESISRIWGKKKGGGAAAVRPWGGEEQQVREVLVALGSRQQCPSTAFAKDRTPPPLAWSSARDGMVVDGWVCWHGGVALDGDGGSGGGARRCWAVLVARWCLFLGDGWRWIRMARGGAGGGDVDG